MHRIPWLKKDFSETAKEDWNASQVKQALTCGLMPDFLSCNMHSLMMLCYVKQGKISLEKMVEKMCHAVAVCFQIRDRGFIREGYHADLVMVDLNGPSDVHARNILYKCGWSPLEGNDIPGKYHKYFRKRPPGLWKWACSMNHKKENDWNSSDKQLHQLCKLTIQRIRIFLSFRQQMNILFSANWTVRAQLAEGYNFSNILIILSASWIKLLRPRKILQIISNHEDEWAPSISNGTIMVMERFYETPLDQIPDSHDPVSARIYKLLHATDYSLTRYSIVHFS